ncbi:TonB-dependent hemoglobin/transferrin/lactoferrin family receptor [Ferrimonas sp. YFM]|uniref:TonB-dependent hemoglobin/transferrin/lactoferrin family receptor n=1 Tax=Ferrimonas sp. YFM TaxID=3028878 RepID=UPI002573470A|nr:TonB-dependent hemoglobin/transferrin/lactoferrin family receptor [Ferrimonas sp. YFM]BDY06931.1 heme/hemoglobin uptake outer membrane receptor PhuR [Ferrimonas sp. YFM]
MFKPSPTALAILATLAAPHTLAEEAKATLFDDVVVSASRTSAQKAEEVPAAMMVVDAQQIDDRQMNNIADLVKYEPGVEVSGNGRFGLQDVTIRGIGGNRVKIMIDGVDQINGYDSGTQFMRSSRNFVDIDSLKQVEVTKSPASSLYGSDAIGGVVAFTTKDPADYLEAGDDTALSIKAGYRGDSQTFSETLTLANRSGDWESLLLYTRRDGHETETQGSVGGIGDDRTKANPMDVTNNNVLAKLIYAGQGNHRAGVVAEYFDSTTEGDLLSENDGEPGAPGVTYANMQADDTSTRSRFGLFHDWQANLAAFDTLSWKLDYQDSESDQVTRNWYSFYQTNRAMSRQYQETSWQFSLDLAKSLESGSVKHEISYGADFNREDLENLNITTYESDRPTDIARYAPKAEATTYGLYLQDEISIGALTVIPGLRYDNTEMKPQIDEYYHGGDDFKDHKSDKLTWRLGTLYQFTDSLTGFFNYAQGFRSPDLKEMYYAEDSGRGYALLANPDLEPEESDAFELGLRGAGSFGAAELVLFYNQYDNFIEQTTDYSNPAYPYGLLQYNNVSEATIKGAEFKSQLWLDALMGAPEGMSLTLSVAYAEGENDTKGVPLNSISPLSGVIGLAYDDADGIWGGTLDWTLVQGKDESDIDPPSDRTGSPVTPYTTAGYGVLDLTAYYNVSEAFVIRGGVFNLLDKKYTRWDDVSSIEAGRTNMDRFTQPGTHVGINATYSF